MASGVECEERKVVTRAKQEKMRDRIFLLAERSVIDFFSTTIQLYSPSKKHRYNDFEGIFCAASDPVGRRQKGSAGAQLEPQRLFGGGGVSVVACGLDFG